MASKKWRPDQGPKTVFEKVTQILTQDSDLKGLVQYTVENPNIRRAYQPVGNWSKLVIYYLQPEYMIQDFSPNIRQVPMIVQIYVRDNDLDLMDISERIIQLLDGADLSKAGYVFVHDCAYTGELGSIYYDDKQKAHVKSLRFMITFRKEEDSHA